MRRRKWGSCVVRALRSRCLRFILTSRNRTDVQDLKSLHTHILTEFVYREWTKWAEKKEISSFAQHCEKELKHPKCRWPTAQLGEPLVAFGRNWEKRVSKLLADNKSHARAAASAREAAIEIIVGPGRQIHAPLEGVPLLAYFVPGTTFIVTAQHANGVKGALRQGVGKVLSSASERVDSALDKVDGLVERLARNTKKGEYTPASTDGD